MRKFYFLFLLLCPVLLTAQDPLAAFKGLVVSSNSIPGLISQDSTSLRQAIENSEKKLKLSDKELSLIGGLCKEAKAKHIILLQKMKESVPYDSNGKVIGKADPIILEEIRVLKEDLSESVLDFLGQKKYRALRSILIVEWDKKNQLYVPKRK